MSKTTNRINRVPASGSVKQAQSDFSVLNDADMKLFQQLVGTVTRIDTLLGKAECLLNIEVCEEYDIIEDIPMVMSELYLNTLRLSALLMYLEDVMQIPKFAETFELAKVIQENAKSLLTEMEADFEAICSLSEDEETAPEFENEAGINSDHEKGCDIDILFPCYVDKAAAYEITRQVVALANHLLHDYLTSATSDTAHKSNVGPDEDSGEDAGLNLQQMSSKELLGLQRLITQELNDRTEFC